MQDVSLAMPETAPCTNVVTAGCVDFEEDETSTIRNFNEELPLFKTRMCMKVLLQDDESDGRRGVWACQRK
jgi:hypothetical protein